MDVRNHPGPQIEALREAKGWTRYRLAKEAAVDSSFVAAVERGEKSPSWEIACRLADALGVRVDRLRA